MSRAKAIDATENRMFAALAPAVLFGTDMFTSLFRAPGHPQTALWGVLVMLKIAGSLCVEKWKR